VDWLGITSDEIVNPVLSYLTPGMSILLHDGLEDNMASKPSDRSATVEAVRTLLNNLTAERYQFLTMPEMSRFKEIRIYFRDAIP
jgi:peptidoglycan/xylan/chitin deacetylase (PgdA/CDA1 family)